jgi:hypothetical protein
MSEFRIDQITNQAGTAGPQIAGITTFSSSSGLLMPSGDTFKWMIDNNVVKDGLVLYLDAGNDLSYPGSGTLWRDFSGFGNDGILLNGVGYNSDNGGSLSFDGVDDTVKISNSNTLKPSSQITIAAWVKPIDITTRLFSEIYRKEDGDDRHLFSFQNNGTILSFGLSTGGTYTELDVTINSTDYVNKWNYLVATYNGYSKIIYKNTVVIGTEARQGLIGTTGSADGYIGSSNNSEEFITANISQVSIYNRALSPQEIQQNFNALRGRYGL